MPVQTSAICAACSTCLAAEGNGFVHRLSEQQAAGFPLMQRATGPNTQFAKVCQAAEVL
jgi:hypothetical protein